MGHDELRLVGVAGCGEGGRADGAEGLVKDRYLAMAKVAENGIGQSGEIGWRRWPLDDELVVFVGSRVLLVQDHHTTGNLGNLSGLTPGEGRAEGRDALEIYG
ncbi:hypothetical protein [Streptomyces sp. SID4941]|uniref:hypothetical protein n=1 Tax=unclassified Streptomyces TaxID=2593676 RepID=UPI0031BB8CDA